MCCVVPALVSLWFLLWCHCACSGGMLGFPRLHSLYRPYGKVSSMRIRVYRYLLQEFTGIYCKSLQVFTVRVPPLWCHPVPKTLRNAWKSSGVGTGAGRRDAQSCPTPNRSCATGKGLPSARDTRPCSGQWQKTQSSGSSLELSSLYCLSAVTPSSQETTHKTLPIPIPGQGDLPQTLWDPSTQSNTFTPRQYQHCTWATCPTFHPSIPLPPFEPKVNLCWGNDTARGTGKLSISPPWPRWSKATWAAGYRSRALEPERTRDGWEEQPGQPNPGGSLDIPMGAAPSLAHLGLSWTISYSWPHLLFAPQRGGGRQKLLLTVYKASLGGCFSFPVLGAWSWSAWTSQPDTGPGQSLQLCPVSWDMSDLVWKAKARAGN